MGQVDDYQLGEEAVAQMQEEQAAKELAQLNEELTEQPLAATGELDRRTEMIDVTQIATGFNIRRELRNIEDLARSIAQRGLHTPLEVRPAFDDENGDWVLISGHRRLAALNLIAAASDDPIFARCEIVDADEADHFALQLIENDNDPLEPADWARGIRLLMNKHEDWTAAQLSKSIGKPIEFTRRHLRLLELSDELRARLESGDLSFKAADLLRKATKKGKLTEEEAVEKADLLASGEMTAADLQAEVAPPKPKPAAADGDLGPDLDDWGDDSDVPAKLAELAPYQKPVGPADRGVDAHLEDAADAILSGNDVSDMTLPWENTPLGEEPATPARTPAWTQLDAYLLGRVLNELASDELLDEIGIDRFSTFEYADELNAGDRAATLRRVAQKLLRADQDAPEQYHGARDADI